MTEIARPHQTRPNRVLITEPITMGNRGHVARWLEDRGVGVAVPSYLDADFDEYCALIIASDRCVGPSRVALAERLIYNDGRVMVIDHAHYKLWYEPIEEGT